MTRCLLADIGGTNARFAWADAATGVIGPVFRRHTASFASFEDSLAALIDEGGGEPPEALAVAAAGPIDNGVCVLTNAAWRIDLAAATRLFGIAKAEMVNDLAAIALSLPHLPATDLRPIGGPEAASGPRLAFGVGTGVGTALLVQDGLAVSGEGGQVSWSSLDPGENAILERAAGADNYLAAEDVLSGSGLARLYRAIAPDRPALAPEAIFAARASNPAAAKAIALATQMLGRLAGDAVLTTGARGGLYLAGGVLPAWGEAFDTALFYRHFTAKGRFSAYMQAVPVRLVTAADPALTGLLALMQARTA